MASLHHPARPVALSWALPALLAATAALTTLTPLPAQADALSTDRPDFVESSNVVGAGRLQIETGISFERDHGQRLRSTPLLLRIGVSDALELRLETDGALRSSGDGAPRQSGYADVSPGLKWHLHDGDDDSATPALALLAHVDVDSGSSAFRGQGLRPSLRGVAEWELPADTSVGVMAGLLWDRNDSGRRFASGILAVTVGKSFSPRWRGFIELAGQQIASRRNGGHVVTFDTGLTWLLNDSLQLDLAVSRGISHAAPDWQWGLGVSLRF